jgi:hypothetical protein
LTRLCRTGFERDKFWFQLAQIKTVTYHIILQRVCRIYLWDDWLILVSVRDIWSLQNISQLNYVWQKQFLESSNDPGPRDPFIMMATEKNKTPSIARDLRVKPVTRQGFMIYIDTNFVICTGSKHSFTWEWRI